MCERRSNSGSEYERNTDSESERNTGSEPVVLDPEAIATERDALGIGAGDAPPGSYVLIYRVTSSATITAGALGDETVPAGAYAYVGSAFGSNGLGRIDRHRRVADGSHDVRHWHIDYLGGHTAAELASVVAAPRADIECRLATELRSIYQSANGTLPGVPIDGFGASDCDCPAHLVAATHVAALRSSVVDAFREIEP